MIISNPITPRTSELSRSITITKNRIAELREYRKFSKPEHYPALNISIDFWLGKLAEYQDELKRVEKYQEELK